MFIQIKNMKEVVSKLKPNKCGTITCIYNIDNKCYEDSCTLHERGFKLEED